MFCFRVLEQELELWQTEKRRTPRQLQRESNHAVCTWSASRAPFQFDLKLFFLLRKNRRIASKFGSSRTIRSYCTIVTADNDNKNACTNTHHRHIVRNSKKQYQYKKQSIKIDQWMPSPTPSYSYSADIIRMHNSFYYIRRYVISLMIFHFVLFDHGRRCRCRCR